MKDPLKNAKGKRWRMDKRDLIFLAIVIGVVTALSLGSSERRTAPTPNDPVHRQVTTRQGCMQCHGPGGIRPQPKGHTRQEQCFQCHRQPEGWVGGKP